MDRVGRAPDSTNKSAATHNEFKRFNAYGQISLTARPIELSVLSGGGMNGGGDQEGFWLERAGDTLRERALTG